MLPKLLCIVIHEKVINLKIKGLQSEIEFNKRDKNNSSGLLRQHKECRKHGNWTATFQWSQMSPCGHKCHEPLKNVSSSLQYLSLGIVGDMFPSSSELQLLPPEAGNYYPRYYYFRYYYFRYYYLRYYYHCARTMHMYIADCTSYNMYITR